MFLIKKHYYKAVHLLQLLEKAVGSGGPIWKANLSSLAIWMITGWNKYFACQFLFSQVLTKKFNYVESFALMDGRLVMCGVAVGVAMFALLWDYLYPFPQSK
jgi:hypothetical protein